MDLHASSTQHLAPLAPGCAETHVARAFRIVPTSYRITWRRIPRIASVPLRACVVRRRSASFVVSRCAIELLVQVQGGLTTQ